jgi:hypothetical protein
MRTSREEGVSWVSLVVDRSEERLVKSAERVRDLGEVFTPNATVQEILNLLPASIWKPHPSPTFLEPACGDGNFLVAILDRKLDHITKAYSRGKLPAGDTPEAAQYHGLEALASIYAVDFSTDNVIGGTPGHENGARSRLLKMFTDWSIEQLRNRLTDRSPILLSANWILEHNIIVGNMLPYNAEGNPTGQDALPLIDYTWNPMDMTVLVEKTTMGAVIISEKAKMATMLSLFGPPEPEFLWRGEATSLGLAGRVVAPALKGPARNSNGKRS